MPTYQYACASCGEQIEAVQKFTDDPLTVCTTCGGPLRKVYSAVGVVFKGSGFYRTDSRSSNSHKAGSAKSSAAKGNSEKTGPDKSGTEKSSPEKSSTASSSSAKSESAA